MRLFLDDVRNAPEGWEAVRSADKAIVLLSTQDVTHISFDHDLGEGRSGYEVVCWIERRTFLNPTYAPPMMTVHSANSVGRIRIQQAINRIKQLLRERKHHLSHEPNELTRKTLLDAEQGIGVEEVGSVDELFEELDN